MVFSQTVVSTYGEHVITLTHNTSCELCVLDDPDEFYQRLKVLVVLWEHGNEMGNMNQLKGVIIQISNVKELTTDTSTTNKQFVEVGILDQN